MWSDCSVDCGIGARTRGRRCDNPAPQHGGQDCIGERGQETQCSNSKCDFGTCLPRKSFRAIWIINFMIILNLIRYFEATGDVSKGYTGSYIGYKK